VPSRLGSIEALRALVGQEFGVGGWLEITQQRVDAFAEATGDFQFLHVDPARAAQTPFGGAIAHGFLTLSLLAFLRLELEQARFGFEPKMTVNYGLNRVRFISPVRVGRRIRLRSKLLEVKDVEPNVYQLTFLQTVELEGAERPAMVAETLQRVYL
jgi:acyl dehydratase